MPEKVTILEDQEIIKVESFGEVSLADWKQSMEEVIKFHQKFGYTKVFVDASNLTSLPSTIPVFEFGSKLAEVFKKFQFAAVTSQKVKDILRFLENVTRNRGGQVRVFELEDAALEWLTDDSDQ